MTWQQARLMMRFFFPDTNSSASIIQVAAKQHKNSSGRDSILLIIEARGTPELSL